MVSSGLEEQQIAGVNIQMWLTPADCQSLMSRCDLLVNVQAEAGGGDKVPTENYKPSQAYC